MSLAHLLKRINENWNHLPIKRGNSFFQFQENFHDVLFELQRASFSFVNGWSQEPISDGLLSGWKADPDERWVWWGKAGIDRCCKLKGYSLAVCFAHSPGFFISRGPFLESPGYGPEKFPGLSRNVPKARARGRVKTGSAGVSGYAAPHSAGSKPATFQCIHYNV